METGSLILENYLRPGPFLNSSFPFSSPLLLLRTAFLGESPPFSFVPLYTLFPLHSSHALCTSLPHASAPYSLPLHFVAPALSLHCPCTSPAFPCIAIMHHRSVSHVFHVSLFSKFLMVTFLHRTLSCLPVITYSHHHAPSLSSAPSSSPCTFIITMHFITMHLHHHHALSSPSDLLIFM